ncbi:MAG: SurA N-terminal domain-containing protein [Pseudomonadota bacterium]
MLSQMRGALKGAVAWFVIILLILAFALWGVPELRTMTQSAALSVGDESYSSQYIRAEFNRQYNNRRAESGNSFTREQALASGMPDQVVNALATQSSLKQFSKKMGLSAPRSLIRDFLHNNEQFANPVSGKFDRAVLEAILSNNGIPVSEFEKRIGDELLRTQVVEAVATAGPAPSPMVEAMLLRETERRRIAYLIVTNEMAGVAAEPEPNDLEGYYEANPAPFTAPEYRGFQYVILREEDFRDADEAPEEELRRIYDLAKDRTYNIPERRTLYQITFETETEANAVAAALRQGKPIETVATEAGRSLDGVTFTEVEKDDILDPAVSDAAFDSVVGEGDIIDPVKSLFGWTVVQVAGVLPAEQKSFEDVRDEIESTYLNQDTRRKLLDAIDVIETARDTGASIADAVADLDISVERVGPVDRYSFDPGGAIIDNIPGEILSEAFRLEEGEESEALPLADESGYFFVGLDEITAPALKPLADVRDDVERLWREEERATRISQTVRSVREAVEGGQSLEEAAATFDRTPTIKIIDRRSTDEAISSNLRDQIFFASLNDLVSGPAPAGAAQVVAQVREIGYGRNSVSPQEVASYERYLGFQLDQELLNALITTIQDDAGVKINRAQIDALFAENQ